MSETLETQNIISKSNVSISKEKILTIFFLVACRIGATLFLNF